MKHLTKSQTEILKLFVPFVFGKCKNPSLEDFINYFTNNEWKVIFAKNEDNNFVVNIYDDDRYLYGSSGKSYLDAFYNLALFMSTYNSPEC